MRDASGWSCVQGTPPTPVKADDSVCPAENVGHTATCIWNRPLHLEFSLSAVRVPYTGSGTALPTGGSSVWVQRTRDSHPLPRRRSTLALCPDPDSGIADRGA